MNMEQVAPYPRDLHDIIDQTKYRPGWRFVLANEDRGQGCEGLTLSIFSLGYDTYHPDRGGTYGVVHYFPVPPAAFDRRAWERWVLDCLIEVEMHECCEFFQIDGKRPYAPNHGPGRNPYSVIEVGRIEDAETRFTGERVEGTQSLTPELAI
jgi:hypothetical protein